VLDQENELLTTSSYVWTYMEEPFHLGGSIIW